MEVLEKEMARFYALVWIFWLLRLVFCTLFIAAVLATVTAALLYISKGFTPIDSATSAALIAIWKFWFGIFVNLSLLLALFRSLKYIFNQPHAGYMFVLKVCSKESSKADEYLENVGYGDLVKVWRKWFMLLIWLVGAMILFFAVGNYLLRDTTALFSWLDIYLLYAFIAVAGYFSFVLLAFRCKNIKVVSC